MNRIRQHRPAFVTGFENEVVKFNTTEELLEIEFVKNFSRNDKFYRYSLSTNLGSCSLMAELEEGYEWWVIGHIDSAEGINLPIWKPKEK